MATACTVVVPVLVTRNDQWTASPRSFTPSPSESATAADFVSDRAGAGVTVVSVEEGAEPIGRPPGSRAVAVAVFDTTPASTSDWVMTYAADVHVVAVPRASEDTGQDTVPANGSEIATVETVVVPVFVTW